MKRPVVALLVSFASLGIPSVVNAQQAKTVYRIGWPLIAPRQSNERFARALEQGLRDHGLAPGKDIVLDIRSADGKSERFAEVVDDLVRSKPDVIVTMLNGPTAVVKAATQTIPIVMMVVTDPVGSGFVQSLAKPGGNVTGFTWDVGGLAAKRLELLKESVPNISRLLVLWEPPYDFAQTRLHEVASILGIATLGLKFSGNLERDFADIVRWRAHAVYVTAAGMLYRLRADIFRLALIHRLPTACGVSEFVEAGCLMSYGPSAVATVQAAARHIDKILKGAKPGDLPVEQPTTFELVINLKTAKALGLTIPPAVLARADEVIQ
jgi:ABC-type uncharacterized transport system substrate-binding protein